MALCGEFFVAPLDGAGVGFLARVDSNVGFQVSLFGEGPVAAFVGTLERPFPRLQWREVYVCARVYGQASDARVLLPAKAARVRLLPRVRQYMALQVAFCYECFPTSNVGARKGSFSSLPFLNELHEFECAF